MADTLRIKRRLTGSPGAPTSLANAELAYNEVDHILYYGEGTGGGGGTASVIPGIGGQGLASTTTPTMNGTATIGTGTTWARADHIHPTDTSRAPLASPVFTGTPSLPTGTIGVTQTPGTLNNTTIATTAFVQSAISAVSAGVTSITGANGISAAPASGAVTVGITANGIANASLGTMPLHTYKGNNTGGSATPLDLTVAQVMTDLGAAPTASPTFTGTVTVPAPVNPTDAATKTYVDGLIQGVDAKASARVATTANLAALSGLLTVDGITVAANDRVLVKDQTTQSGNGVYLAASGAWTRALDMDAWTEFPSAFVFVEVGTANADSGWLCTVDAGGTLGTTNVTWVQFSGAGQIVAGAGLTKTGNQLDAVGTANRITVAADSIDIAATYVGQSTITTLGTVTTGVWNGTTIAVANGGSGAATLTGYLSGNGTSAFTASATIPNTAITGLGTMSTQNATAVAITGGTVDGVTFDMGTF